MRRAAPVVIFVLAAGCRADAPALVVDISSELAIGTEANDLAVRVRSDGTDRVEQTYALGEAPRDRWPQSLPILAGDVPPKQVTIAGELRVASEGRPSIVVGYGEVDVDFPAEGEQRASLEIYRACVDADGDGFGVGFGCAAPDCDDGDPNAPMLYFCGDGPQPDGGVRDAGGPPRDAGEVDGGRDAGGPPRDGGFLCGNVMCEEGEACFSNRCWKACMSNEDCGALHLGCLTRYGVCICRVPCRDGTDCGPLECLDGCCQL